MIRFKFTLILFFLSVTLLVSHGQNKIHFKHIGIKEGLPKNKIFKIIQEKDGFIWIGTDMGLFRFDGYDFMHMQEIPDLGIFDLAIENDSLLWVGARGGLYALNLNNYDVIEYKHNPNKSNSLISNQIETLFLDSKKQLWIGTKEGLSVLDPNRSVFTHYFHTSKDSTSISHNIVRSITEDANGKIWVGTYNGLNTFNALNKRFRRVAIAPAPKGMPQNDLILDLKTYSLMPDFIFAGTIKGVFKIQIDTKNYHRYHDENDRTKCPSHNAIKSVGDFHKGYIPIGTDYGFNLLSPFDGTFKSFFYCPKKPESISNNVIWCSFVDQSGVLWIGTNNGINLISNKHGNFEKNHLLDTYIDISDYDISCFEENKEYLWIGSNNGIAAFHKKTGKIKEYSSVYNPGAKVNDLIIDSEGILWGATNQGLYKLPKGEDVFLKFVQNSHDLNISSNYINSIIETADKSIWIATGGGGINRILRSKNNAGEWVEDNMVYYNNKSETHRLPFNSINIISSNCDSIIWIGSYTTGLVRYNYLTDEHRHFTEYNTNGALPSNNIRDIDIVGDSVFVCTSNGLAFFHNNTHYHI